MKKNQKGFTLVELIIAVAILAVVTLSVCGFIVVGSRSYTSANTDIMLQQEAQLALNQISDVIIDTTDSINYGNGTETVLKDSEFSSEPDEKILVIVNKKGGNNDNDSYRFEWSKDTETIYFNTSDTVIDDDHPEPVFVDADRAILAQHVKELHIDISQFEENRVVMISMTFQNGNKEYTTSNNVTVRNRVALNKIDIEPMKKAQEFTITTVKNIVLEPGDSYNLADHTEVKTTSDDDAVRWELVDPGNTTSTISSDGQLNIGIGETRESFLVKVVRVSEEYVNQNVKVAKTVKVRIKRANTVNLSCSETTIKPGSTVTVNGSAVGYLLGSKCNGCLAETEEELKKDHDLVSTISAEGWRIVRGPATIDSADSKEAKIKILSTAKKGDEIEIEARAMLPDKKGYGPVTNTVTLTVTEGTNGAKYIGSELKFGTDNDPGIFDYMRSHLRTDHWRYVFCIRIRESGASDYKQDWVMLYYTLAANERFAPDIFGLDLTKTYEIYFQVLDPRPKGSSSEASDKEIISEYFDDANLDDNGKYIGTKFESDEYYYAIISQPVVGVEVDGVKYPNEDTNDRDRYAYFTLQGGNGVGGPVVGKITPQTAINIDFNTILNNMAYTAYKEDENGNWIRVCGVSFDDTPSVSQRTGTERIGELDKEVAYKREFTGQKEFGDIVFEGFGSSMTIKRNSSNNPQPACGIYHIVPGFVYTNNLYLRDDYYLKDVIYKKAPDDYKTYYYKQWDAVINVKIDMGINLQLPTVNGEERWTYFPVPSDRTFPFDLKNPQEQITHYSFKQYSKNGDGKGNLGNSSTIVSCVYSEALDEYTITLKDLQMNGKEIKTHVYGVYTCKTGKDKWVRIRDEYDVPYVTEINLTFTKEGETYDTFFPIPSDGDFPFKSDDTGEQVKDNWVLVEFRQNDGSITLEKCTVKCTYNNGTYSIELIVVEKTGTHRIYTHNYGTFECKQGEKKWVQTKQGYDEEGTDLKLNVVVTVDGKQYDTFFPTPTDSSFPISGDSGSVFYTLQIYEQGDLDGKSGKSQRVTVVYSNNNGTYSIEFIVVKKTDDSNSHKIYTHNYGTFECKQGETKWVETKPGYVEEGTDLKLNIVVTDDGNQYDSFFPAPTDNLFPFLGDNESISYTLQAYNQGDLDGYSRRELEVTAAYSNGELEFYKEKQESGRKWKITGCGKYRYNNGKWEPVLGYQPEVSYIAKWEESLSYFEKDGVQYKAEIPLPGESGLPALNGTEEQKDFKYYVIDDSPNGNNYGENSITKGAWCTFWHYTGDETNGYWLEIRQRGWIDGSYVDYIWLKLKYDDVQKAWVSVN